MGNDVPLHCGPSPFFTEGNGVRLRIMISCLWIMASNGELANGLLGTIVYRSRKGGVVNARFVCVFNKKKKKFCDWSGHSIELRTWNILSHRTMDLHNVDATRQCFLFCVIFTYFLRIFRHMIRLLIFFLNKCRIRLRVEMLIQIFWAKIINNVAL